MGVSGTGKSTLAETLAARFDLEFVDADDYHGAENRRRMAAGIPLRDTDREPWMAEVCAALLRILQSGSGCALAHSALQRARREQLRRLGFRTLFIHLEGDRSIIHQRLVERRDHYMPASLLQSQFETLEDTTDEKDVVRVDIGAEIPEIAATSTQLVGEFITRNLHRCAP